MDEAIRNQIRELLETGLSTDDVSSRLSVPKGTVSAVKAHITMGSYVGGAAGPRLTESDVAEIEDAGNLKFGLERDMQSALRQNIHQLDPTLRIIDEGKERRVDAGFIDILAADEAGAVVVIELKSGEAPETAITQLLSYIGSLQIEDDSRPIRGMLIARDFSTRVCLAAHAAGIQLVAYGFNFSFTILDGEASEVPV
ncbi:MAG: endonuclease NucS domain-containing protein [Solirubrobacteraceae bacterium]